MSKNPIKLLKMVTNYENGGTEGQVYSLVSRLNRSQFEIQFGCLHAWGDYLDYYQQQNIPISEFKIKSLISPSTLMQQVKFAKYLRRQGIQIVHSYNYYANVFALPAAKMAGVPRVFASIRDRGVNLSRNQKRLQKWACGFADRILVNADSIEDWLVAEGYPAGKITVIKNGLDLSRFQDAPPKQSIREEFNIPPSSPVVVMISRLYLQKGVGDFIEAAGLVSKLHPDVRFLLVGGKLTYSADAIGEDTAFLDHLKQLVTDNGLTDKMIFAGTRDDIPDILKESTVSVLPSHNEGLSNTLLESMAAGLPVIATDVGGSPEIVKDGVNGLLVPVKQPEVLAQAIEKIITDPALASRFGAAGKRMVEEHHCLQTMVEKIENLYKHDLEQIGL